MDDGRSGALPRWDIVETAVQIIILRAESFLGVRKVGDKANKEACMMMSGERLWVRAMRSVVGIYSVCGTEYGRRGEFGAIMLFPKTG
ncbi:hypothetical protein PG997_003081 [Apiospora hydei]|uniref:Uncharacterized protein n=1 Tax=Apiospora hydei TaxID=1337664 RepID=A0ABR1WY87_9PEZI